MHNGILYGDDDMGEMQDLGREIKGIIYMTIGGSDET